jgi:hypothetical protein
MKKKIFIGMAALFFAAVTFYNVQVSQQDGEISLENVALMAQASSESGGVETYMHDCSNYNNYRYCTVSVSHLTCTSWVTCP